ncbi:MAG: ribbon-helix-helix domain-containing protein [Pseudohongiellaceae bacterium]
MAGSKIAISLDTDMLREVDALVDNGVSSSRSRFVQQALEEKLQRMRRTQLAEACGRLDREEEQELAEEGLDGDLAEWPEY